MLKEKLKLSIESIKGDFSIIFIKGG